MHAKRGMAPPRGRAFLLAAVLASIGTAAPTGASDGVARSGGPFNALEWTDGVATSRDGYAVWVSTASTTHRARLPGHDREVGPPEHGAALRVACRAAGGPLDERVPPNPAAGHVYLEIHPDAEDVYTVFHPMFWILELAGRAEERWPVEVRVGANAPIATTLVRKRIDYSVPRPGLHIALPGVVVIDAIGGRGAIEVEVDGAETALSARFEASANARRAAALMRGACVQEGEARSRLRERERWSATTHDEPTRRGAWDWTEEPGKQRGRDHDGVLLSPGPVPHGRRREACDALPSRGGSSNGTRRCH